MTGRLVSGVVLLVGGIMFAQDGIELILDVLGELFAESVISPDNVTEGTAEDAT